MNHIINTTENLDNLSNKRLLISNSMKLSALIIAVSTFLVWCNKEEDEYHNFYIIAKTTAWDTVKRTYCLQLNNPEGIRIKSDRLNPAPWIAYGFWTLSPDFVPSSFTYTIWDICTPMTK